MASCSQVVKFMMAWLPFMTMVRMVLSSKQYQTVLVAEYGIVA